jgi:hypothetical protein
MKLVNLMNVAIVTMSFVCTSAFATPILTTDNTIYDNKSGLEWMQLTETEFLSWNEVTYLLQNDIGFIGWRFADMLDIEGLLSSYSTTSPSSSELMISG